MDLKFKIGINEESQGVTINLDGCDVATAIDAWLVSHRIFVSGPRTIWVNEKLIESCRIFVDPSGFVIVNGKRYPDPGECPRCNAQTAEQAESMCQPGVDECPMCETDDWSQMLLKIKQTSMTNEAWVKHIERLCEQQAALEWWHDRFAWLRRLLCRLLGHRYVVSVIDNGVPIKNYGPCMRCGHEE